MLLFILPFYHLQDQIDLILNHVPKSQFPVEESQDPFLRVDDASLHLRPMRGCLDFKNIETV